MKNMSPILLFAGIALLMISAQTVLAFDGSFIYAKCNSNGIPPGSPFWGNLGTTLNQLTENTAYADGLFKTQNGGKNCPAYGEATCTPTIPPEDCTDCLRHLSNRIWSICNDAIGADVKFGDCSLHYEAFRFD